MPKATALLVGMTLALVAGPMHTVGDEATPNAHPSPNTRFIVTFPKTTAPEVMQEHIEELLANGGEIHRHYQRVLLGFSATIPASFIPTLLAWEGVRLEEDAQITLGHEGVARPGAVSAGGGRMGVGFNEHGPSTQKGQH